MKLVLRIITGIILLFTIGLTSYLGSYYFNSIIIITSCLCLYEILSIKKLNTSKIITTLSLTSIIILCISTTYIPTALFWKSPVVIITAIALILLQCYELKQKNLLLINYKIPSTIFSILQIGLSLPFAILIRQLPNGLYLTLLFISLCVLSDIAAYFTGKAIGKTPLNSVSPKKTWEGTIAGLLFSLLTCLILIKVTLLPFNLIYICIIIAILCPLGDLYESLNKRAFNTKDSSTLLPGHGGFYDRLDSYIFGLPIFYYGILLLERLS
tara:strand:- start:93 stop:899 length:807 start_codon:yes stop_codon:yes gene_type:complete